MIFLFLFLDFSWFPACMAGPGVAAHPICLAFDGDGDGDVDLRDWMEWQNELASDFIGKP